MSPVIHFDLIDKYYKLNVAQVKFCNFLLDELDRIGPDEGLAYKKITSEILEEKKVRIPISEPDIKYALEIMVSELGLVKRVSRYMYKISHKGQRIKRNYNQLSNYLAEEVRRIEDLSFEELKRQERIDRINRYKLNYWWLGPVVGFILGFGLHYLLGR